MQNVEDVLRQLSQAGIKVFLQDGKLNARSAKKAKTPEMMALLRANKSALTQFLLANPQLSKPPKKTMISAINREEGQPLPLSCAQQRLWFIDRLGNGSPEYNITRCIEVDADFDVEVAQQAFSKIIERHEILRTTYGEAQQKPVQTVHPPVPFCLERIDLSHLGEDESTKQLKKLHESERDTVFDLTKDLMLRGRFVQLGDAGKKPKGALLFTMHHIASDGWSMDVMTKEFMQLYQSIIDGQSLEMPPLSIQYGDYAIWQQRWLKGELMKQQQDYWLKQLANLPQCHSLPLDFSRPSVQKGQGAKISESLSVELSKKLLQVAKAHKLTGFMLLHGILALVLSRYGNTEDVVIGSPMSGRTRNELAPLIGFFVNTLVLRVNTGHTRLSDYLSDVKQVNIDAQRNQDMPFERLVEALRVVRDSAFNPVFQIMFNMYQSGDAGQKNRRTYQSGMRFFDDIAVMFDLTVDAELNADGGELSWSYDKALFRKETIERLHEHMMHMLHTLCGGADINLNTVTALPLSQIRYLTDELNTVGAAPLSELPLIHQAFERQAELCGNAVALVVEDSHNPVSLSYRQLNAWANQLAGYLIAQGIKPDMPVGICLRRNEKMLIALLAVLKAGGAFVALDPEYPRTRLNDMVEDCGAALVICEQSVIGDMSFINPESALVMDDEATSRQIESHSEQNPVLQSPLKQSNLAYIVYTSGSTGKAKGVMIEHAAIANHIAQMNRYFAFTQSDVVLQLASMNFDTAYEQLFGMLCCGGQIVLSKTNLLGLDEFFYLCGKHKVTTCDLTPLYLNELIAPQYARNWQGLALNRIVVGGETLSQGTVKRWFKGPHHKNCRLFNAYGPTETTITATIRQVEPQDAHKVSIGRPIAEKQLYVLDQNQQLVPFGAVGELYIGGNTLARGYLNRESLTESHFPKVAVANAQRLYRTGDLVRYLPDGSLEFIGRADEQVKIRGFRIELGEIEYQLSQCDGVTAALVLVDENSQRQKRLLAYVEPQGLSNVDANNEATLIHRWQQQLQQVLPNYMLPEVFVVVEQWPLMANGKVDKKALPTPSNRVDFETFVAPQSATEKQLAAIYAQVISCDESEISSNADFFAIGGNSITAMQVVSKAAQRGLHFPLSLFYQQKSISALAKWIEASGGRQAVIDRVAPGNRVLASRSVQDWWRLMDKGRRNTVITGGAEVTLYDAISERQLRECLAFLHQRHSVFTTVIEESQDKLWLKQDLQLQPVLIWHDISDKPEPVAFAEDFMRQLRTFKPHYRTTPLDKRKEPLATTVVLKTDEVCHVVFLLDHTLSDGFSSSILCDEFKQLVSLSKSGQTMSLAEKPYDFIDYCHWSNEIYPKTEGYAQAQAFWQAQAKHYRITRLAHDLPYSQRIDGENLHTTFSLNSESTMQLKAFCRSHRLTLSNGLYTLFQHFIAKKLQMDNPTVGIVLNGRSIAGTDTVVGQFFDVVLLPSLVKLQQLEASDFVQMSALVEQASSHTAVSNRQFWPQGLSAADHRELSRLPSSGFAFSFDPFETTSSKNDLAEREFEVSRSERPDTRNYIWLRATDLADNIIFSLELDGRFYEADTLLELAQGIQRQFIASIAQITAD